MKKIIILLGVLNLGITQAQVGINTESPTRTLDVNGTTRVRDLIKAEVDGTGRVISKGFPYNIIATEDGTLAKQPISRTRWNLYESDFSTRQNDNRNMPSNHQFTADWTPPGDDTWEIPDSKVILDVPKIEDTEVLTVLSWHTWFEIVPRSFGDTSTPITPETSDRGSFRFFIKFTELNADGQPTGTTGYTDTVFMTSFSNVNQESSGMYHRIGATPSYAEKNQTFFKAGKKYEASLVVALESMREANQGLEVNNWGIDAQASTYYKYK